MKIFNSNFIIKDGIYCTSCADLVKKIIEENFNVKNIKIDLIKNKLQIASFEEINCDKIKKTLRNKGYTNVELNRNSK